MYVRISCTVMGKSYSEKVRSRNSRQRREKRPARSVNEEKPPFPFLPMTVIGIIVILLVSGIVMFALNNDKVDSVGGTNEGTNGNNDEPKTVPRGEIRIGSTDGSEIYLDRYEGKVIILDMFATWCGPCKTQMEELDKLTSRFTPDQLVILSVGADLDETMAQIREFEKDEGATWPFARSNSDFNREFPASSIPTLYILNTEGQTAKKHVGVTDADILESEVRALL